MMYNPLVELLGELFDKCGKWFNTTFGRYCLHLVFSVIVCWVIFAFTSSYLWSSLIYFILVVPVLVYIYFKYYFKKAH